MKTVLFAVLVCALFQTACQKENSANLNDQNGQKPETDIKGAVLADAAALRKIPVIVVSNSAANARKNKTISGTTTPPPPTDTTTTTSTTSTTDSVIVVPAPTTTIPSSYSLVMPPIGYQGSEGSCVSWAVAYGARSCKQYYATNALSYSYSSNIFSPEYVFNQTKSGTNCASSSMLSAMDLLVNQGVCTWQSMPYSYLNGCSLMPTSAQTAEAANYKIPAYARVLPSDQTTIKTMIAQKKTIPFTFNTDYTFDHATTGTIWTTYSGFTGAHAMVLCGYDDSKHAYRAMNCWGTSWGDAGYIWIDYNLLPVISFEAYVMN
jgi:C1A family cysteine protease